MRRSSQESISNLSNGLLETALQLLQVHAFPVYRKNQDQLRPPVAYGEYISSGIAILLLSTGLDYHLSRLKFLRDDFPYKPPLPYTPYFNWKIDDALSTKIKNLLVRRNETRLKEHLLELTAVRDSVAHPKLYRIKEAWNEDLVIKKIGAKLVPGVTHRGKTAHHKMARSEFTRRLRLPLVPVWISYPNAVTCVLVLNRFLNLLEENYGNYYAMMGRFYAKNEPAEFFEGWAETKRHFLELSQWAGALFSSLSQHHQGQIRTRLGKAFPKYLEKPRPPHLQVGKETVTEILKTMQNPRKPKFLHTPPPWGTATKAP